MQIADNAGATNEHRAVNYLLMRYPDAPALVAMKHQQNESLTGIQAHRSTFSNTRQIIDVTFSFTHRQTGVVEMHCASVDTMGKFPFLVKPLSLCFER
jgi:hypothetical protein